MTEISKQESFIMFKDKYDDYSAHEVPFDKDLSDISFFQKR